MQFAEQSEPPARPPRVLILGAGPAGLTAAYELARRGVSSRVLELEDRAGGLSRTLEHNGYLFDIGGHRFFTKVSMVERIWREVLGPDLLERPRLSRIYYKGRFFQYPLEVFDGISKLGLLEVLRCGFSYLHARLRPARPETTFETWVSNRFGRRLFEIFFRSYTEKVWGMPCHKIGAEWASQRIRGLSVQALLKSALRPQSGGGARSLTRQFLYPRRGPGMMWTRMAALLEQRGCSMHFNTPVDRIEWDATGIRAVTANGRRFAADQFISSLPIRELIARLDPAPPSWLLQAAGDFHYRDFITVAVILRGHHLFPDNWIYIHDPGVAVGRIQNYGNWSPEMVPQPDTSCLGLEYFCFEGDGLWQTGDSELIARARRELAHLGLAPAEAFLDARVLRIRKAYPVYDESYRRGLEAIRRFLAMVPNLQLVGRNGMHRYNNQDHSMLTGILAARNVLGAGFDLWELHRNSGHLEEGGQVSDEEIAALERTQPLTPAARPA
jgi:protoporphyrinogen oxidase